MRCFLLTLLTVTAVCSPVSGMQKVISTYGGMISVPCNNGNNKPSGLMFTMWKSMNRDGTSTELLVKQPQKDEAMIKARDSYKDRINIAEDSSLLIQSANLNDERVFTCIVVTLEGLMEYSVEVEVHKKPTAPEIKNKAVYLENGKLMSLGDCIVTNSNPPAEIIWLKNNMTLVADGKTIISPSITKDPVTGLSTTTSNLKYVAGKEDKTSWFSCSVKYLNKSLHTSASENFNVHYPTEKVSLDVLSPQPIREGDNVTLRCEADGNPYPTGFNFHIKGKKVPVSNSDLYVLSTVTREDSGEYKCSLLDNDSMESSMTVTVTYLDLSLEPTGSVQKNIGESLEVKINQKASGNATVLWTKNNMKIDKLPDFSSLMYNHSGLYVCEVSVAGITRHSSFELMVEGKPEIKKLTEELTSDGSKKVLICEVEGSPEPAVTWSVNGTQSKTSNNGVTIYKLFIAPITNLTVTCQVINKLGSDTKDIYVSSLFKEKIDSRKDNENDKAKVIGGVIVGLIVAVALVGVIYFFYTRRRQGSWKTGEKETGNSEENKKLEENNHSTRQDP